MADRYIPEHRRTQFKAKNAFKPEELRRRREEQQVEIRKSKREENLAKRRGIGTGERLGASLGAAPDSDDETAPTEAQVSYFRYIFMCVSPGKQLLSYFYSNFFYHLVLQLLFSPRPASPSIFSNPPEEGFGMEGQFHRMLQILDKKRSAQQPHHKHSSHPNNPLAPLFSPPTHALLLRPQNAHQHQALLQSHH